MKITCLLLCMAVFSFLMLAGCEAGNKPPAIPEKGQPLPPQKEYYGLQGPFPDRSFTVVQRQEIWEALWGYQDVPDIDFSRQMALVALMGQQPTTGYDIHISDVRTTDKNIVAYIDETRPTDKTEVEKKVTYPFDIVVIPKMELPVSFVPKAKGATPIIPIVDSFQGLHSSAVNAQTAVIRDQLALAKFWGDNFGVGTVPPQVDFVRYMVVAVFLGTKPTGGYSVAITSIDNINDRLVVNYRKREPSPDQVVTQALTSPYAIAVIPVAQLPVTFNSLMTPVIEVPTPAK